MAVLREINEEVSEKDKASFNLKANNIKIKMDNAGSLIFIIPKTLELQLRKQYNFSVEKLSVGGDISLAELAIHCDEQSSMEYHIGTMAEFTRYQLKQKQDEYELWYSGIFYKVKRHLIDKGEKNLTDKSVESYVCSHYADKVKRLKGDINELEMQYRLLNNVIKASIVTKGAMLPQLRNIVQGKDGIGIGNMPIGKKCGVRNVLRITK